MNEFMEKYRRPLIGLCLAAILAVAFLARARHFNSMVSYFQYQDETRQAEMSLKVIREKTFKPDFYLYPQFPVYFNSVFYAAYLAKNHLREIMAERSLEPIVRAARNFDAAGAESLYLQRSIAMLLGMLSVFGVWLMARLFLSEAFALTACLIFSLLPLPLSFSVIGKTDIYLECSLVFCFYYLSRLIMEGRTRDYFWSAVFGGICYDSKVDYAALGLLFFATLIRAMIENRAISQWIRDKRTWLAGSTAMLSLFIFSPYYFINIKRSLQMIGWVFAASAINSYDHLDYHHWWLDRYSYCLIVLLPFIAGLPVFLAALAGFAERIIRLEFNVWYLLIGNFGVFIYMYLTGSGGSFPLYLFMHLMPFFAVLAAWPLQLAWKKGWKKSSAALAIALVASAAAQAQNYYAVSFEAFDRIGPKLAKELPAGSKILGYSVYLPGPALSKFNYLRAWPQNLDQAAIESYDPDYILVYRSDFAGFEKFYRDTFPINSRFQALMSGEWGYRTAYTLKIHYPGDFLFQWLDPEFMIELVLLEKVR